MEDGFILTEKYEKNLEIFLTFCKHLIFSGFSASGFTMCFIDVPAECVIIPLVDKKKPARRRSGRRFHNKNPIRRNRSLWR